MYDKDKTSSINPKNKNNTEGVEYSPKTSLAFVGSASSVNNFMYRGYIKLWRKGKEWAFSREPLALALWVYLLWEANHKETKRYFQGKITIVNPGQLLTGRKYLADIVGISEGSVEKYLKLFEIENQLVQQKTNKNRLITILNWEKYQSDCTTERQPRVQQNDTPKNDKNNKNDNNIYKGEKTAKKEEEKLFKEKKKEELIKQDIITFWEFFLLKTKKRYKLTPDKKKLIGEKLEFYELSELKLAVENFIHDDWPGRKEHLDLIYCIGKQKGKPDNLEKWLNMAPKKKEVRYE